MPAQFWEALLNPGGPWQTTSGVALNSGTAATIISPSAPDLVLPANWWYPGAAVSITARGIYTMGSTATNLTFALFSGGTGGVALATTGAVAGTVSQTNLPWKLTATIQCRATGPSGNTLFTQGELAINTGATTIGHWPLPATAGPTAAAVNTTTANSLVLAATLSQNVGTPAITCTQWLVESLD